MNCLRISSKILSRKTCFEYSTIKHLSSSLNSNRMLLSVNGINSTIQKRNDSSKTQVLESLAETSSDGVITSAANKLSLLADAPFTHMAENMLIYLNGLELFGWSASIFVAALLFRLFICFPIKVYQERTIARLLNVQPKVIETFNERTKSVNKNAAFLTPELKKKLNKQRIDIQNEFYKKENCQPQKIPIASLLQFPVWIFISTAIRNFSIGASHLPVFTLEQLSKESFLWLPTLCAPDPYYILPIAFATIALTNIKYASLTSEKFMNKIFNFRKNFGILLIGIMALLISNMPASVGLFWVSSNSLHLVETLILDSIVVRRMLKIPKTVKEPINIYQFKYKALVDEIKKLKNFFK